MGIEGLQVYTGNQVARQFQMNFDKKMIFLTKFDVNRGKVFFLTNT